MSGSEQRIQLGGRTFILIGTAHVSAESVAEVTEAVRNEQPDCVAVELDEQRLAAVRNPNSWKELDIVKVLRQGQGFMLLANLMLSSFQRRMGANTGIQPGDEMKAAVTEAESRGIPIALVDRPIQITLRRAWARNSLWGKCKLLAALLEEAFSREEVSSEQIEALKGSSEMDSMMEELSSYLPAVKGVLIDERDRYLASRIWKSSGNTVLAVLGAGHLAGVGARLEALAAGRETGDTADIETVPPKGIGVKIAGLVIPLAIIALIAAGFFAGGADVSGKMLIRWLLWNCSLSAAGALIAAAHPLAILAGFVCAPIGTLNPVLSVGLFSAIVQAWVRKPKIEDMQSLTEDAGSLKGFYRNRILRVLLVFILTSLGGAAGNIIAVPALVSSLAG